MTNRPRTLLAVRKQQSIELNEFVKELTPILYLEAHKINLPNYIDKNDLVQEAWSRIFEHSESYDESKGASFKTWCINVARKRFLTVAKHEFRDKRMPKKIDGTIGHLVDLTGMNLKNNLEDPDHHIMYDDCIKTTRKKLRNLSRKVFDALLNPPDDLMNEIRLDRIQCLRAKHMKKRKKIPYEFAIKSRHLAHYFNVSPTAIIRAKGQIRSVIQQSMLM